MRENVPFGVASARELAAGACRESFGPEPPGNFLPPDGWFMRIAHGLWGENAAKMLRFVSGFPERTCRSSANGHTDPSGSLIYVLLRDGRGDKILDAIMEGSNAAWWRELKDARALLAQFRISKRE